MSLDGFAITAWVQPETILLDVDVRDRDHALESISEAIGRTHALEAAPIARALKRREQAASTALGDKFALPHARIAGLERPLTLFMRTARGIAFDAPDGQPVSDLLAIMVPEHGDKQDHLNLLALISRLFADRAFRSELDAAPDPETTAQLFRDGVARQTAQGARSLPQ